MTTFREGDRVVPSGEGRTARWPKTPGTVIQMLSEKAVEVIWDGTAFGDEMGLVEIVPATGDAAKKPATEPTDLRQIQHNLDDLLGAEPLDDRAAKAAGLRLYDVKDRTGRTIKVTIPENDNA